MQEEIIQLNNVDNNNSEITKTNNNLIEDNKKLQDQL